MTELRPSDESLVRESLAGDTDAWDLLFERHHAPLYNFLAHRLASHQRGALDDLFQQTMLRAVARLERFDPSRGAFGAWLGGIAINEIRQHARRVGREVRAVDRLEPRSQSVDPTEPLESADRRRAVNLAFSSLAARHQRVLELRYWHDKKSAEIATVLEIDHAAVASLLYRARSSFAVAYRRMIGLESNEGGLEAPSHA